MQVLNSVPDCKAPEMCSPMNYILGGRAFMWKSYIEQEGFMQLKHKKVYFCFPLSF